MERRPAFENYLRLMSEGVPSREAGPRSFGPLANLGKELEDYRDGRISYLKIDADRLPVPHVSIERLDEGSAQAVEHYAAVWLDRGDADAAAAMREVTARYPEAPLA